jgi:transcriptional regulator with XRE-family HTH domain
MTVKLRERRLKLGLRLKDIADACGVTESAVCRWESGRTFPKMGEIDKVCNAYKARIRDLYESEEGRL